MASDTVQTIRGRYCIVRSCILGIGQEMGNAAVKVLLLSPAA